MTAWNSVLLLVNIKLTKKDFGTRNLFFHHFLKFVSLVFFDIAQGCSLGHQCPTSSRAVKPLKKSVAQIDPSRSKLGLKWGFPDVIGHPVKPVFYWFQKQSHPRVFLKNFGPKILRRSEKLRIWGKSLEEHSYRS